MKNLILDTNIFVRFLIKDIPSQLEISRSLFKKIEKREIKGMVSILVIDELVWVLENYYGIGRNIYISQLLNLLALKNLVILETKKIIIMEILNQMRTTKLDFTDIYLNQIAQNREIASFDKDLKKLEK